MILRAATFCSAASPWAPLDGVEEALQWLRRGEGTRAIIAVDPGLAEGPATG